MIVKVDRSLIPGIRGFNSIFSFIICSGFTLLALLAKNNATLQPPTYLISGIFFIGCFLCIVLVRAGSLFSAIIQPPIILTACTGILYWFTTTLSHDQKLLTIGISLAQFFPTLFITCISIALIGLIRWYIYRHADILATPRVAFRFTGSNNKLNSTISTVRADSSSALSDVTTSRHSAAGGGGTFRTRTVSRSPQKGPSLKNSPLVQSPLHSKNYKVSSSIDSKKNRSAKNPLTKSINTPTSKTPISHHSPLENLQRQETQLKNRYQRYNRPQGISALDHRASSSESTTQQESLSDISNPAQLLLPRQRRAPIN